MIGQLKRVVELQNLNPGIKPSAGKNVITFTSGKGGAGKTVLSLNLAYQLSKQGYKVLFADLDINFANAHILLNLIPQKTLNDFFEGKSLLTNLVMDVSENLFLLPGSSGTSTENNHTEFYAGSLIAELKRLSASYDYIFIDTGQMNDPVQLDLMLNSDATVIITSPEPTAVMDAYVVIKMLKQNKSRCMKYVIVNKCSGSSEANIAFNNLNNASEHFLHEKLLMMGYISFDQSVHKSIINQELLLKEISNAVISKQFRNISDYLIENVQVANIHHPIHPNFDEMWLNGVK